MPDQIFYVNSASISDISISSSIYVALGTNVDFSQAIQVSGSFVGNLVGNASTATTSSFTVSSSHANVADITITAQTASYISGQRIKSGIVSGSSFNSNHPSTFTVTFITPFPNIYSVTVTGEDSRTWVIQNKTSSSFTINANSNQKPSSFVYWQAIAVGEFNS